MEEECRKYALDVSQHFFALAAEGLRLHSIETRRFQSLSNLVNARALPDRRIGDHRPEIIRSHLSQIPTKGDIHITLKITKTSADTLAEAKARLGRQVGASMTVGDALSLLLLDYIVEKQVRAVEADVGGFDKLLDKATHSHDELKSSDDTGRNVFNIR